MLALLSVLLCRQRICGVAHTHLRSIGQQSEFDHTISAGHRPLAVCRTVAIAIVLCMIGVTFITQPSILGFEKNERSMLGVFFALFQVSLI